MMSRNVLYKLLVLPFAVAALGSYAAAGLALGARVELESIAAL